MNNVVLGENMIHVCSSNYDAEDLTRREILNSVGPEVQDHVYVEASLWPSVFTGAMVSMMEDQSDKFWNNEFRV